MLRFPTMGGFRDIQTARVLRFPTMGGFRDTGVAALRQAQGTYVRVLRFPTMGGIRDIGGTLRQAQGTYVRVLRFPTTGGFRDIETARVLAFSDHGRDPRHRGRGCAAMTVPGRDKIFRTTPADPFCR